ncbi:Uncharacterised protein [Klebsiella pneumoniae]|nr:Uncharacterised protein [Klebsiella pneumoniae]
MVEYLVYYPAGPYRELFTSWRETDLVFIRFILSEVSKISLNRIINRFAMLMFLLIFVLLMLIKIMAYRNA